VVCDDPPLFVFSIVTSAIRTSKAQRTVIPFRVRFESARISRRQSRMATVSSRPPHKQGSSPAGSQGFRRYGSLRSRPGYCVRGVHGRACDAKVLGVGAHEYGGSGQSGLEVKNRLRSDAFQVNVVVLAADKRRWSVLSQ